MSYLPSGLIVSSFCWSINWTYLRLIVLANINVIPSGVGLRPKRMFVFVCFSFLFFSFLFLSFLPFISFLFRVYVYTMDMFLLLFRCKPYEMVYHSSLLILVVSFPCVLVLRRTYCFVLFHRDAFCSFFVTRGWISGKWPNMRSSSPSTSSLDLVTRHQQSRNAGKHNTHRTLCTI